MQIPRWKKIDRRRKLTIKYTDPEFNVYYDIDTEDFQNLVMKLKNKEILTEEELEEWMDEENMTEEELEEYEEWLMNRGEL